MKRWPREPVDESWRRLVQQIDPARVDELRGETYRSYERYLRGALEQLDRDRPARWSRDYSSIAAYERSVEGMRSRLKGMLGSWMEPGERGPLRVHERELLLESGGTTASRFRFEILPGLESYAVELTPTGSGIHAGLIAQHGYGGTPELVCGLAEASYHDDYSYWALGLRAARRGFHVIAVHHPTSFGAPTEEAPGSLPGFPDYPRTYGKNRLHRLAIMGGGTLFGLDMMASSRGVDLLAQADDVDPARIAMYGLSQGGESALYLPAMDRRIRVSVSSAYFNRRLNKLIGPHRAMTYLDSLEEDKFFRDVVSCFSDSDIASLIAPRSFAVEAGMRDSSVDFERAREEFEQARLHYERLGIEERIEFIAHDEGHTSMTSRAFDFIEVQLSQGEVE